MLRKSYTLSSLLLTLLLSLNIISGAEAARIKDLATIQGVRENQLMGYGLVIGLDGTGDDISKSVFTNQAIMNMIKRMGMAITSDVYSSMKTDNIAGVIVTARLPPFAKPGSTIDIHVASIGDASSLAGGNLLMTPLKGPDGNTYAVAQGPLAVGGISYGGKTAEVQKNFPTAGRISGGAIVERQVNFSLPEQGNIIFQLKETDFTTTTRMTKAINSRFGSQIAHSLDSATVQVALPDDYTGNTVEFISELENIDIEPDAPARIVVNERTGTIVMGQDVRISTVAVSHGNLNLVISEPLNVSQPNPLATGQTVAAPQTSISVLEEEGNLIVMERGVNIGEIAKALNAIGATPRDLIAIFQAIKAAGALQGELVIL